MKKELQEILAEYAAETCINYAPGIPELVKSLVTDGTVVTTKTPSYYWIGGIGDFIKSEEIPVSVYRWTLDGSVWSSELFYDMVRVHIQKATNAVKQIKVELECESEKLDSLTLFLDEAGEEY